MRTYVPLLLWVLLCVAQIHPLSPATQPNERGCIHNARAISGIEQQCEKMSMRQQASPESQLIVVLHVWPTPHEPAHARAGPTGSESLVSEIGVPKRLLKRLRKYGIEPSKIGSSMALPS